MSTNASSKRTRGRSKKVCSDLEFKEEVDADERLKGKVATRRGRKAAETKTSKIGPSRTTKIKLKGGCASAASKGMASKQSIKRVREQRRMKQREAEEDESSKRPRKNGPFKDCEGTIITAEVRNGQTPCETSTAPSAVDFFWEVESVVGRQIKLGRVEYLIRWKGCSEDQKTWEPAENLCDTAMDEAMKFCRAEKLKEKQREEDEKKLFGVPNQLNCDEEGLSAEEPGARNDVSVCPGVGAIDDVVDSATPFPVTSAEEGWDWTDEEQVKFREVKRINVHDPNAPSIIREARVNGTPVVLVGHVGWANFAERWLTKRQQVPNGHTHEVLSKTSNGGPMKVDMAGTKSLSTLNKVIRNSLAEASPVDQAKEDSTHTFCVDLDARINVKEESTTKTTLNVTAAEGPSSTKEIRNDKDIPLVSTSAAKGEEQNSAIDLNQQGSVADAKENNDGECDVDMGGTEEMMIPIFATASTDTTLDISGGVTTISSSDTPSCEEEIGARKDDSLVPNGVTGGEKKKPPIDLNQQGSVVLVIDNEEKNDVECDVDIGVTEETTIPIAGTSTDTTMYTPSPMTASNSGSPLCRDEIGEQNEGLPVPSGVTCGEEKKPAIDLNQQNSDILVTDDRDKNNFVRDIDTERESGKTISDSPNSRMLDLSDSSYQLDIPKMIKDIGDEDVPVIRRNYNEENPIHGKITAEKYLTECWSSVDSSSANHGAPAQSNRNQKKSPQFYLHQWQFPLSDTAGRKLCHQNNPFPNGIMGEDLLKYWIDLPQCKHDSPLQYIFMGREETMSKLHKDTGGLDISIAPVVGQKECVLVHRSDGSNCMYHITAPLDDIDLHKFPLLSQARIWRTVVKPGEILLMPQGTYHQCRNVTPCLSYSRFHLDTVNILPFFQSLVDGDAPEIDHEDVLWNITSELIKKVDAFSDDAQMRLKKGLRSVAKVNDEVASTVNILRTIRHFVREIVRRDEIRRTVKGNTGAASRINRDAITTPAKQKEIDNDFAMLLCDVDLCLHEFRFRRMENMPEFKPRRAKALKNTIIGRMGSSKYVVRRDLNKENRSKPVVVFSTSLENNYLSIRGADVDKNYCDAAQKKTGKSLIGNLQPGDKIVVKLEKKHVKAEVEEIVQHMNSAYISFEDYPSLYDEYQPYECVRLPTGAEIAPQDIKSGLVVIDISNSNDYRGVIQSVFSGPMARVKLFVSEHVMSRWISPQMILDRYVPKPRNSTSKKRRPYVTTIVDMKAEQGDKDDALPPKRPIKVDQMVDVQYKHVIIVGDRSDGFGRVTKLHFNAEVASMQDGEKLPSHVDVQFVIGKAHPGKMIPIEFVALAPELEPGTGRSSRHKARKKHLIGKGNGIENSAPCLVQAQGGEKLPTACDKLH